MIYISFFYTTVPPLELTVHSFSFFFLSSVHLSPLLFFSPSLLHLHTPSLCSFVSWLFCVKMKWFWKVEALLIQLCPTLSDTVDCSPPDSSVHGILQARILESLTISFSSVIFPTQGLNLGLLHCRQTLYSVSPQGALTAPCACPWCISK